MLDEITVEVYAPHHFIIGGEGKPAGTRHSASGLDILISRLGR